MQGGAGSKQQPPEPCCQEPKVFIGQIPFESTQEQVYQLFSQYGTIQKCAVITGPDGRSKGCAMVTYSRWSEAEAAVDAENGTMNLGAGKVILVKFANPPRGRGDGPVVGIAPKKLFVGQIPNTTTQDQIRQLFSPFGNIVDIHVLNKGNAPACAFVTYERWGQAESALAAMNNSSALDAAKGMSVKFADAKIMPDMGHNNKRNFGMEGFGVPSKRAFTGGMQGMPGFNPYGMAGMGYDMSGMMSMGYNGMMGAMPGMHGMALGGMMGMPQAHAAQAQAQMQRPMGSKPGAGSSSEAKAWKLFVGQVPFEATEADLWPIFSQYGNVLELVLLYSGQRSKGCAFVTYETRAMADKAIGAVDGQISLPNDPKGRVLVVKYANSSGGNDGGGHSHQGQGHGQGMMAAEGMGGPMQAQLMGGMPGAMMMQPGMATLQGMQHGMSMMHGMAMPGAIVPGMTGGM